MRDHAKTILTNSVFYGIVDSGYLSSENMYEKCAALIAGGASIIQLRAKKETPQERASMARLILPLFENFDSPIFIINDDIELASSIPNAGLHIGQDDIDPHEARKIMGPDKVIGLSTHSFEQAKKAESLKDVIDYFAVGPIYLTNTKPGRQAVGLDLIKEVSEMNPALPWFGIGGVNQNTAQKVYSCGAKRIVSVSDVLIARDTAEAVKNLIAMRP